MTSTIAFLGKSGSGKTTFTKAFLNILKRNFKNSSILLVDNDLSMELSVEILNLVKEEINIEENRNVQRYSIVIYFTKPGDSLWKIAKKFRMSLCKITRGSKELSKSDSAFRKMLELLKDNSN